MFSLFNNVWLIQNIKNPTQGDGVGDDAGGGPDSGTAFTWVKS